MEESKLQQIMLLIVGYVYALLSGFYILCSLYWKWLRNPFRRFWLIQQREVPPECLNDPALGNHVYIQLTGVKLHYVENGDKSKPLMLLIHGFPEFWYSWRHQLKEFSSDYWVVAIDMRGYGDSEKPACQEKYKIDYLISDIKELITELGRTKCTLVSHDWGGIVAWFFVLLEPNLIDSYIIMNSAHPIAFMNILERSISQIKKSWYIFFFQIPYLPELMCRKEDMAFIENSLKADSSSSAITEQDIEAFKFTFGKPGAFTFPINYYRANFTLKSRSILKGRGQTSDFPPGLVLYGERDCYLDWEVQEESAKMVSNAKVVYIKANHFVQQDEPVAVNQAMRNFFNECNSEPE